MSGSLDEVLATYTGEDFRRALDRFDAERSLYAFIRLMWPIVEPETPFVGGWVLEGWCEHLEAVTSGQITRLLGNVPPGSTKSLATSCLWPAWEWAMKAHLRYICAAYGSHLTTRDNRRFLSVVSHPLYREMWGDRFTVTRDAVEQVINDRTGWKLATSVGGVGTGERADRIIIDDPNNPNEVESETVMQATTTWFREVMPDRLNNLQRSAIVVIQQRTSDLDVSGVILDLGLPYVHFQVPMEYDPLRHCSTVLGWQDPRGIDEDGELLPAIGQDQRGNACVEPDSPLAERQGLLAWPERFPIEALEELKTAKGPWAYCTPVESPVLMADLSLKPIGSVRVNDEIIGFDVDTSAPAEGRSYKRRRLAVTRIKSISRSVQPVVKITLDSGAVIRCTPDHRWYTRKQDATHALYMPARIGKYLFRVCPAEITQPDTEDGLRDAGWLAGFFDGEGSATLQYRGRPGTDDLARCLITFSQGSGRNAPICERLEKTLDRLGFEWGYAETPRSEDHSVRWYYLKTNGGGALPLMQKFLHVVRPAKWRDRIVMGALGAQFCGHGERVVSIEPDGVEEVFGLETGTGNYVVWGLASSNSAQYQMLPVPRGGGIIKEEWWRLWSDDEYPNYGTCVGALDTAFKEHQEADYSAMTVWGAFEHPEELRPKLMLRDAWQERLNLQQLIRLVIKTCRDHKVDTLLIEDAARGGDIRDEIQRQLGRRDIRMILVPADISKVARLHACVPVFYAGVVYAPERDWSDMVIRQVAAFPRGHHDDLTDTVSLAINYLRTTGVAVRAPEYDEDILESRMFRKRPAAVYDV